MFQSRVFFLVVWVPLFNTALAHAQTAVSIFYALPADGAWVEYDFKQAGRTAEQQGTLRVSAVGRKTIGTVPHCWVEIKLVEGAKSKVRKLLVAEKAQGNSPPVAGAIAEAYVKDGDNVAVLGPAEIKAFLNLGITGELKEVSARETLEGRLGKLSARRMSARNTKGEKVLEYQGWLTKDVPFGCARFEIHEKSTDAGWRVLFSALAARAGTDAKSELDETKVKMKK